MRKLKLLILTLIIAGFVFNVPYFALGQSEGEINEEIKELNSEIQGKKSKLKKIEEQKKTYSKSIIAKQQERASLANQLAILDNRIAKAELDIDGTQIEIDRVNLEIKKVNTEIKSKNEEIQKEKDHISNILKIIYKQSRVNTLEIMLLNDSLSEFLNEMKYLEDTNKEVGESLDKLKRYKRQLENSKERLNKKDEELDKKKEDLNEKKLALESEKENKFFILDQVRNSEAMYQSLLSRIKSEQSQAASDIASLEKSVRTKIANMQGERLEFNDGGLVWPVPKNVITSYFHDPEYPFRYIFEHPAIDIRAGQGTILKASASGYVARAKNAGKGYSYIMIIHGDGISTVYGHVSKIYVKEDEYVVQGQTIGLSGGMPGTPGAGRFTTGPHLHFEVRKEGIPVNPLEYLP